MRYFGVVDDVRTFFMKKRLNFQKIESNFYYEEAFSRYQYANIPYFLTFFQCFACNWPTRCEPFFSKFLPDCPSFFALNLCHFICALYLFPQLCASFMELKSAPKIILCPFFQNSHLP